jgi:hypothetical protein
MQPDVCVSVKTHKYGGLSPDVCVSGKTHKYGGISPDACMPVHTHKNGGNTPCISTSSMHDSNIGAQAKTQAQQMGRLTMQAWPIIRTHSRLNIWTPSIKGVMKIRIIIIKN